MHVYRKRWFSYDYREELVFRKAKATQEEVVAMLERLPELVRDYAENIDIRLKDGSRLEIDCETDPMLAGQWNDRQFTVRTSIGPVFTRTDHHGQITMGIGDDKGEKDLVFYILNHEYVPTADKDRGHEEEFTWVTTNAYEQYVHVSETKHIHVTTLKDPVTERYYEITFDPCTSGGWWVEVNVHRRLFETEDNYDFDYLDESIPEGY